MVSDLPGWAWVSLVLGTLAAAGLLGAVIDRRFSRRRRPAAPEFEPEDPALRAERLRLATELHETVSHEVSAVLLHSAGARAVPGNGDPRVSDALEHITRASTNCMQELVRQREVLHGLGGTGLGTPGLTDLSAVGDLLGQIRDRGADVDVEVRGNRGTLDPSIGRSFYLVVADVVRHAELAVAPRIRLDLTWAARSLQVRITLTGTGIPPQPPPSRVLLTDRVRLLGGELETRSLRRGQAVTLTLPVQPRKALPQTADVATASGQPAH